MSPAVLKIILVVLSVAVVVVKGYMAGTFDVAQISDLLAGVLAGSALVKRPGDEKAAAQ